MTTIRKSIPTDGPQIMRVWRSAVDATHHFLAQEDRQAIEDEVAAFLPTAPLWLAVDADDHAMGFMYLHEGHMEALFIDAGHRGAGIGRALLTHALQLHPALTADVNEQNVQAVGFYERMGFQRVGRSGVDGQGRPYPLIHLRYEAAG